MAKKAIILTLLKKKQELKPFALNQKSFMELWPNGKAFVFDTKDCRFESSWFWYVLNYIKGGYKLMVDFLPSKQTVWVRISLSA